MKIQTYIKNKVYDWYMYRLRQHLRLKVKKDLSLLKKQGELRQLTRLQKNEIIDYFYGKTGLKVSTLWHQYYYSRSGNFILDYIPEDFYICDFIYRVNQFEMRKFYSDKNQYDLLFKDYNRPKTIIKRINGLFYTNNEKIPASLAVLKCSDLSDVVIKPSVETSYGDNISLLKTVNGNVINQNISVEALFHKYGKNFIVQEKIKQNSSLAILNPNSVNTIRVFTVRIGEEIKLLFSALRVGRSQQMIDNIAAGGMYINIHNDGSLDGKGYDELTKSVFTKTISGIEFNKHCLTGYDKVVDNALKMHENVPYLNLIGWDFSIGEDGEPIFIELNRCPDLCLFQPAVGSAFKGYIELFDVLSKETNTRSFSFFK